MKDTKNKDLRYSTNSDISAIAEFFFAAQLGSLFVKAAVAASQNVQSKRKRI